GLWAQRELVEAGGGLQVPGDPVLLSCRSSGFAFRSNAVLWYRQAPAARLEWVSTISAYSSVIKYGSSVRGRATTLRDNAQSMASLSLQALNHQDSARYFCSIRIQ
ncbi:HV348 protein, partial [Piaya cayana]|nr:HV348 protein [Piaya cayana]